MVYHGTKNKNKRSCLATDSYLHFRKKQSCNDDFRTGLKPQRLRQRSQQHVWKLSGSRLQANGVQGTYIVKQSFHKDKAYNWNLPDTAKKPMFNHLSSSSSLL